MELNIITKDELNKCQYITNLEAIQVFHKVLLFGYYHTEDTLSEWYRGNTLEPLDYLEDDMKILLLDLLYRTQNIFTSNDFLEMQFQENMTNFEALKYITRIIGDTYSCVDHPEELDYTKQSQTYKAAYKKGIINEMDMENADQQISREDFFTLLHKAIFVNRFIGGEAPTEGKYIDDIVDNNKRTEHSIKEKTVVTNQISPQVIIHNDLSITWVFMDESKIKDYKEGSTSIYTISDSGTINHHSASSGFSHDIKNTDVIKSIITAYPEKLDYFRIVYSCYDDDFQDKKKWYFDIDISDIHVVLTDTSVEPGMYTHFKKQWVPESISLAEGNIFQENAFYLLSSYKNEYRKPEYNIESDKTFEIKKGSEPYLMSPGIYTHPFKSEKELLDPYLYTDGYYYRDSFPVVFSIVP